jgi:hypothetical protein
MHFILSHLILSLECVIMTFSLSPSLSLDVHVHALNMCTRTPGVGTQLRTYV